MTAQIAETLLWEGAPVALFSCPPLPLHDPRLRERTADEAEDAPAASYYHSTACWRGYVATWEIREDRLWLLEVRGRYILEGDTPLWAAWVTATLRVPQGELLHYCHAGFLSVYEEDLLIEVVAGCVQATRRVDNRQAPAEPLDPRTITPPGAQ